MWPARDLSPDSKSWWAKFRKLVLLAWSRNTVTKKEQPFGVLLYGLKPLESYWKGKVLNSSPSFLGGRNPWMAGINHNVTGDPKRVK